MREGKGHTFVSKAPLSPLARLAPGMRTVVEMGGRANGPGESLARSSSGAMTPDRATPPLAESSMGKCVVAGGDMRMWMGNGTACEELMWA